MIFQFGVALFIAVFSIILLAESNPALTASEETTITFTLGQLYSFVTLLFILVNVWILSYFILSPVIEIVSSRKRKKYPLSDPDE